MTVSADDRRKEYPGNDTAVRFDGPRATSASHIAVYLVDDVTGVATLTTAYTLTNTGGRRATTITMDDAPATGTTVLILRTVDYSQNTDITNQGAYLPEVVEAALDALEFQIQQVADGVSRSLRASDTATGVTAIPLEANRYVVTDSDGNPALADDPPVADLTLRGDLASTLAVKGAYLVGYIAPETGGVARTMYDLALESVSEAEFGVVGDGSTNDKTALDNAMAAAVSRGRPLSLDGSKTYGITGFLSFPANLRLVTNGATFRDLAGTTSNTAFITVGENNAIDQIRVEIPTGIRRDRAVLVTSANPQIERIFVTSVDQQANTGDNDDAAVRVSVSAGARIRHIEVENFDQAAICRSSTGLRVHSTKITSYVRGLLIEDCVAAKFDAGHITETSPNASYTAGHVGVLFSSNTDDAQRNVTLQDFVIEDSGEHGIRVGGPAQQSNLYIVRPRIKNTGGSGIKILGTDSGAPADLNKRVFITDPVIEDCGSGGITSNMCGILAMYCAEVHITNPVIRKESKLQSGYAGIRLVACDDVHITEPEVADATYDGLWLDGSLGDIGRTSITGGMSRNNGQDGLRVTVGTSTFRRIKVDGLACDGNTGLGLNVAVGAGTMTDSLFRAKLQGNTAGSAACDSTAAMLDIAGAVGTSTPLSGITAADGSTWRDTGGLVYHRIGADWIGRGRVRLGSPVINNNAVANTIQDVTGLAFPVKVGSVYRFRFVIPYAAAATTTGSRWSINGPAAIYLNYRSEYSLGATSRTVNDGLGGAYDAPAACNTDSASLTRSFAIIEGIINPNADGTIQARFASEVAGSAITASAHAYVDYEEVTG